MSSFTHRLSLPHPEALLAHATHLSPQSGVQGAGQGHPGPAAAGEPAAMMILGVALVAATMVRRWHRASARLASVTRRARAEVVRSRALVQR